MNIATARLAAGLCLAASAGAAGCGGGGSAGDQIRNTIIQTATLSDPSLCTQLFTDSGIQAFYSEDSPAAARKDCEREAGRPGGRPTAADVKVTDVRVTGNTATATASANGRTAHFRLVHRDGAWKIAGISSG